MSYLGESTITGQITSIRDGEKRMSRSFTYGYMVLSVRVGIETYSVLVDTSKLNKFGFLPRVGQIITVVGVKTPSKDGIHDFSISHVSELIHTERNKMKLK